MGRIPVIVLLCVFLCGSVSGNLRGDLKRLLQLARENVNNQDANVEGTPTAPNAPKRHMVKPKTRSLNGRIIEDSELPPIGVTAVKNKGIDILIEASSRNTRAGEPDLTEQVHVGQSGQEEVLAEGDMNLMVEQWDEMEGLKNGSIDISKRKGQANTRYRWTNNIVPYEIQNGAYSDTERADIISALEEWSGMTCVIWQPRTTEANYVKVQYGNGCSSYVGMISQGEQAVTLGQYCSKKDVVLHEFGHALGLMHEQSRHDRDDYVTVHLDRVDANMASNFDKYPAVDLLYFGEEYDYTSIMHYGEGFFSLTEDPTITTNDPTWQKLIGTGSGLSFTDVKTVNMMYNCGASCSGSCPGNGFMDKNCVCQCKSDTSVFDFCGHVPYTPCDGSAYLGPSPKACPSCSDNRNEATCKWYKDGNHCHSSSEYTVDANENCYRTCSGCGDNVADINECTSNQHNCAVNAQCVNTQGGFTCTCNSGYSGDGTTCTYLPRTCGGSLGGSSGVIRSPNFPADYSNDVECEWTVTVPEGKVISFQQTPSTEFSIEITSRCQYDALEIDYADHNARACGNAFTPLQTTTNTATLTFESDNSVTLGGFSITYTVVDAPGTATPDPCAFICGNGYCVPESYRCDTDNDCGNWADEQNCG